MRLADSHNAPEILTVYNEALSYAFEVGHIDWERPFPPSEVAAMIESRELYCFDEQYGIAAAVKLTEKADPRIWRHSDEHALYFSRLATANAVRGQSYLRDRILPSLAAFDNSKRLLRADCLADNPRLQDLYFRLGFVGLGNMSFYSARQLRMISVTKLELAI